jgi:ABC-type branched-subunit amino acid transport system ATPase component
MSVLEVSDLHARYSAKGPDILKGISFDVEGDDFFAIIGPSGAGKSTLIRCINRLVTPTSGSIVFDGRDMTTLSGKDLRRARRDIGMIFQEFNLINRMSVMDNVLSGRLGYTGNLRTLFRAFPRDDKAGGRVVGRSAPAGGHRAGVDAEPEAHAARRADLGARPQDFEGDHGAGQIDGAGAERSLSLQYP